MAGLENIEKQAEYKHLLSMLLEAISYSYAKTDGTYGDLALPVVDKVKYIQRVLYWQKDKLTIEKELKALKIIMEKDVEIKYVKMAIEAEKKENNPKLFPAVGFYNNGQRNVDKCLSDDEFDLLREVLE